MSCFLLSKSAKITSMFGFLKWFRRAPRQRHAPKTTPALTTPKNVFATGNFEHISLYDLLVTFSINGKSAKISISVKGRRAMLYVSGGELQLAMYHAWMGKEAVIHIFQDIEEDPSSQFLIKPILGTANSNPANIALKPLLKEIATMLDNYREQKNYVVI